MGKKKSKKGKKAEIKKMALTFIDEILEEEEKGAFIVYKKRKKTQSESPISAAFMINDMKPYDLTEMLKEFMRQCENLKEDTRRAIFWAAFAGLHKDREDLIESFERSVLPAIQQYKLEVEQMKEEKEKEKEKTGETEKGEERKEEDQDN